MEARTERRSRFPIRVALPGNAQPKRRSLVSVECLASDLDRLCALLPTFEHQKGIRLFDELARDPANAAPILQELLAVVSNHDDPQLHTPHGMLTVHAGRDLLRLTRPPGGLGLLRFLVLYNFSLQKRPLTAVQAAANARTVPSAKREDMEAAYRKVVHDQAGPKAAALLGRIALDHGSEAAMDRLSRLVEEWEFDRVEGMLRAFAFEGQADVAYRPLLIAASADPGFLGHTLSQVHAARIATRYLTPSENAWLLWKLY